MTAAASPGRLRTVVEPVVAAAGYDLEDFAITPAGRRRVVRLVVDRDGGVDLGGVAELSRVVSGVLDASAMMGETPYLLEVTSPGVDRPLSEPRHWRRAVGRLVTVALVSGGQVRGRVASADAESVTIGEGRYGYAELGRGRIQVEWS